MQVIRLKERKKYIAKVKRENVNEPEREKKEEEEDERGKRETARNKENNLGGEKVIKKARIH